MFSLPHTSGIYSIRCLINNRIYIGSSQDISKRCAIHWRNLRAGKHHCAYLQNTWNKYGESAFVAEVLELVDKNALLEKEQAWFRLYDVKSRKRTFNTSYDAVAPMKGRKHSPETKQRFSESRSGTLNANYKGNVKVCAHCGVEFRSRNKRARYCSFNCYATAPKSPETIRRYSETSKGRKRTPEAIEKGREKRSQWFIVTDPSGVVYEVHGLAKFCREHGLDQGSMSHVALGNSRAYRGWLCKKISEVNR